MLKIGSSKKVPECKIMESKNIKTNLECKTIEIAFTEYRFLRNTLLVSAILGIGPYKSEK